MLYFVHDIRMAYLVDVLTKERRTIRGEMFCVRPAFMYVECIGGEERDESYVSL